jgi:Domain of unknown function (DUF5615)
VIKPKLFVDEDACEEAVVAALRRQGMDLLTVLDVGRAGIGDDEQLRFATSLGRAIYTLNARHFASLHREILSRGEDHAGIIVIPRQRYRIGEKVRRLRQFLDSADAESLKSTLHFL